MTRILIGIVFLWTSLSHAGVFTNGGNSPASLDTVWFLGDEPVEYCVEWSPSFSFSEERSRDLVRDALDAWVAFLRKYELDKMSFGPLGNGESLKMSTKFIEVESCSPDQGQLVILLGKKSKQMADLLDSRPRTLGLSVRFETKLHNYRKGGSVYIAGFLNGEGETSHVLRHELGHIFGMRHDSIAIMAENVGDILIRDGTGAVLGKIETPDWPYRIRIGDDLNFSHAGRYGSGFDPLPLLSPLSLGIKTKFEGGHSVKLKFLDFAADIWSVALDINDLNGRSFSMKGRLRLSDREPKSLRGVSGPVLYSSWQKPGCEDILVGQRFLDKRVGGLEMEGTFSSDGIVYPAIVQANPNPVLKIFVPQAGKWWSSAYYSGGKVWRR